MAEPLKWPPLSGVEQSFGASDRWGGRGEVRPASGGGLHQQDGDAAAGAADPLDGAKFAIGLELTVRARARVQPASSRARVPARGGHCDHAGRESGARRGLLRVASRPEVT
ncbi:hypothetical protein GCM10010530_08170 [Kribbella aluminosa]